MDSNTITQLMGAKEAPMNHDEAMEAIEKASTPEELRAIMEEQGLATKGGEPLDFDKYTKEYAKKKTRSLPREEQLMEGSGEPFTPPVSTEDVAGL